jgi:hypothetical protein
MSDLRSAVNRARLLDNLYAAAETMLQAVADPVILDKAPLNHRVQALDAIGRFIDRIEKYYATTAGRQEKRSLTDEILAAMIPPPAPPPAPPVEEPAEYEGDLLDAFVALAVNHPGCGHELIPEVARRIEELRRQDPALLDCFDPESAWIYMESVYRPQDFNGETPPLQPEIVRSQRGQAA